MTAIPITRQFVYNGVTLPDPNPNAGVEDVRRQLSVTYPGLATAKIDGPEYRDAMEVYTFRTQVGTKG